MSNRYASTTYPSRPTTGLTTEHETSRPTTQGRRPWTAQSRPTTARPLTAASVKHEGSYVIALLEGRGVAREVGMAALDKDTGKVMLVQLADCQTYVKTLHQMHLHSPSLILVPDTFLSASDHPSGTSGKRAVNTSMLVEFIREEFPGVPLEPIGRRYWNDSGGLEFILQLCVEDDERAGTILAVSNKYYALSATCALFKHAESKLNIRFASGSLPIRYVPVEGTMMIDPDTAKNLELVGNMAHKKSTHSLFGILNHTFTAMAARLLRANILSPVTVQASIDARLDVVEEFIQTEDRYTEVRGALKTLNKMDFDKLIVSLAAQEVRLANTAKPASARVLQMLNLRSVVKNLPLLQKALAGSQSQLLRIICDLISDERLAKIEALVNANLNEDGAPVKGGIGAVNARVYAVKAHCNRLLDVARETYKENVGDIFQLNRTLSEEHELPLTLVYQDTGFVFTLKKTDLEGELPKGFINVSARRGKWVFSSMDLKKMNARMKDALDETLVLSEKIIQDLVAEILVDVGALYKASEAVALVDMLWSFAHSSIMYNYVRPEFTGTLAIKSGRHPVLETIQSAGTLVPNDVYCDDSSSFQIIQGPNMSGKSTYLRQIGLLTVMAMCGCFVPAEYASFRIHDSLLTRLSNDDDMEKNLSTFASEMASSAMILGLATPNSLVLIDELGRGTSPRDGVGISHAIAEELIVLKPFVFFATHFKELTLTLSRQPTVVNLHLSVHRNRPSASNFGMTFQYKWVWSNWWIPVLPTSDRIVLCRIVDGAPEDSNHYGLELARLADLPDDVLTESKRVAETLAALHAKDEAASASTQAANKRKALLRLRTQLIQALDHSALPDQELRAYLRRFQDEIAKVFLHTG
ncbi:muts domain V-domain-containing protein [Lyophyllum atratum]|nr:muts domain V-domain-containing protein [Lyophyllum atratum]